MTLIVTIVLFGIYTSALLAVGSVGFSMQFGVTNVLNLAYGAILTSCIFVEYWITDHSSNVWLALLVGALAGAAISFVIGHLVIGAFLSRGASGFSIAMVTIAIALMVEFGLEAIQGPYVDTFSSSTTSAITISGVSLSGQQLAAIGIAVVAMIAVHLLLRLTKLGLAMRATADNAALARSVGVSPARTRAAAWLISGTLCGICGVLLGLDEGTFSSATGDAIFVTIAAAAVVGGIGKPYGAMIGALLVGLVSEGSAAVISPSYKSIAAWVLLIVVLMVRPQGIFAEYASRRELVA
jgi:branched-chain amino acid transport system permease protein/neutral amino acid transport system permease protein